jgi:glutathione synthase/RimK-type ligase-like ATP-grasp enzyme
MKDVVIVPYRKKRCIGARGLAKLTEVRCHGARVILSQLPADIYVNWGSTGYELRQVSNSKRVINPPEAVYRASNKVVALETMENAGVRVPWFTDYIPEAVRAYEGGKKLIGRTVIRGSGGMGVSLISNTEDIEGCVFFTEYIPKCSEFRIHVFEGTVIDITQKRRPKRNRDGSNPITWGHKDGFCFYHRLEGYKENYSEEAIKAVGSLGLDFGAVDVVVYEGIPYVLEVNTAPGLSRTQTLEAYFRVIRGLQNG